MTMTSEFDRVGQCSRDDARGHFNKRLGVGDVQRVAYGVFATATDEDHFVDAVSLRQGEGQRGTTFPKPTTEIFMRKMSRELEQKPAARMRHLGSSTDVNGNTCLCGFDSKE